MRIVIMKRQDNDFDLSASYHMFISLDPCQRFFLIYGFRIITADSLLVIIEAQGREGVPPDVVPSRPSSIKEVDRDKDGI